MPRDFDVNIPVPETRVAGVNKKDQDRGPFDVNSVNVNKTTRNLKRHQSRRKAGRGGSR